MMWNQIPHSSEFGVVRLEGGDAIDFAQRIFTRNLMAVREGEAKLAALLAADGSLQNLFWLLKLSRDCLELYTFKNETKDLISSIENYRFSERFSLSDREAAHGYYREQESPLSHLEGEELYVGFRNLELRLSLRERSQASKESESAAAWEKTRILNGLPKKNWDYFEKTLIFDLGLQSICDSNKGCYIGQEVVERVISRGGSAANRLVCLRMNSLVSPEAELFFEDDSATVGNITKSVIAANDEFLALAYVRRARAQVGTLLCTKNPSVPAKIDRVFA